MPVLVVNPPADTPVTLSEAKAHLRVDSNEENDLVSRLIGAATRYVEELAEVVLCDQQLRLYLDAFPATGVILIPKGPVTTVASVKHVDANGQLQTISPSIYKADLVSDPARLVPAYGQTWPATRSEVNAVQVDYLAGVEGIVVDPRAKQAVLLLVGHWYEHREAVLVGSSSKEVELAVASICRQLWPGRLT